MLAVLISAAHAGAPLLPGCGLLLPAHEDCASPAYPRPPVTLGAAPLCEGSAALALPTGAVLVADNEVKDTLFVFTPQPDGLLTHQQAHRFADEKRQRVDDIEAMTFVGEEVLVVGSHSRKKWSEQGCRTDSERRRLSWVRVDGEGATSLARVRTSDEEWAEAMGSTARCQAVLFGGAGGADVQAACGALVAAEQAADSATGCGRTLNIEGALTDAAGRVWLGLRAPVDPEQGAMLLRLPEDIRDRTAIAFDAVAWVALPDGSGVRELRMDGERILGIAGPAQDSAAPFLLWQAPASALSPGAHLSAAPLQTLPSSSEGLVRQGDDLLIVIDGREPEGGAACDAPSQQLIVPAH